MRELQFPSSLWIAHIIICPAESTLCAHKSVKAKTWLLVLKLQGPTLSKEPASPWPKTQLLLVLCLRAKSWRLLASVTLMKSPYTKQIQAQTFATNYGSADQSNFIANCMLKLIVGESRINWLSGKVTQAHRTGLIIQFRLRHCEEEEKAD